MKTKLIIITAMSIVGSLIIILFTFYKDSRKPVAVDLPAPVFEISDPVREIKLSSKDIINKVIFVNFWASWCPPCREEMPSIQKLFIEMSERDDFRMITILYRDSAENGLRYLKENGYSFPVYMDVDDRSERNFGITGVPETYVIDKKRILRRRVIGPSDWYAPEEKLFILSLLDE